MDKNILLFVGVVHTRLGQSELNLSGGLESLVGLHCGYLGVNFATVLSYQLCLTFSLPNTPPGANGEPSC